MKRFIQYFIFHLYKCQFTEYNQIQGEKIQFFYLFFYKK